MFGTDFSRGTRGVVALDDFFTYPGPCAPRQEGECDFEGDECGWVDSKGSLQWKIRSGSDAIPYSPKSDQTTHTRQGNDKENQMRRTLTPLFHPDPAELMAL